MTNPPGPVYEWGQWESDTGVPFPIRLLAIENKRIVWQIAGAENEAIKGPMEQLESICESARTLAEGVKVIGQWKSTQWYSEMSFTLDVDVDAFKRVVPLLHMSTKPCIWKFRKPSGPSQLSLSLTIVQMSPSPESFVSGMGQNSIWR